MNRPINRLNKNASLAAKLFLATTLMAVTSVSMAKDESVAYVDSVLKWGAWELDIEPAAGGISAPANKTLNARGAKVTLRTNSIAALAPHGQSIPGNDAPINRSPGTSTPQHPSPTRPAAPPARPVVPAAPANLAPSGAITSIGVSLPPPPAPTGPAPTGAITATVVTLQ